MTQEFQKFTPDTVDEQIERISNSVPTNTENYDNISGEYVVHSLRHLYQSEQRDRALAQGWQRIVQASNSTDMQDTPHLEQDDRNEGSRHPFNIHAGVATSGPDSLQQKPDSSKGRRRIAALAQPLAAVMLVSVVLASFLAFIVYRTGTPGAKNQNSRLSTIHSIVATVALDGTVYAFQPGSKRVLWTFSKAAEKRSSVTAAVIVQGRMVYAVINGQMYALNAIDGTLLWQQSLALPNSVQNSFEKLISDHDVLYVGGTAYVGKNLDHIQSSGNIYAIRTSDGKILWHYQDTTPDPLITASNKNVYVISGDTLLVLHGDTGKVRWKKSSIVPRAIVADDTTAYVDAQLVNDKAPGEKNALVDATLLALNTQDGHVRWSTPVLNLMADHAKTFVLHQGTIILSFMSDYPYTYHFCEYKTSNGAPIWCSPPTATPTGDGILSYTVMNGVIYAGAVPKNSIAIEARNAENGKFLWSTSPSHISRVADSIIGLNGVIYVLHGDISAFDGKSGHELWQFSMRSKSVVMVAFAVGSW